MNDSNCVVAVARMFLGFGFYVYICEVFACFFVCFVWIFWFQVLFTVLNVVLSDCIILIYNVRIFIFLYELHSYYLNLLCLKSVFFTRRVLPSLSAGQKCVAKRVFQV